MRDTLKSLDGAMGCIETVKSTPVPDSRSLVKRSVSALKWSYFGVVARIVLQLGAQITLARFIGPAAFGVVAAALIVISVAMIVVDLGLGAALVQARTIEPADVRTIFTRIMFAAIVASVLIIASAELVAGWFGNPEVVPVLRWMTLLVIFQAFSVVSNGLLRRDLDFKTTQIAQTSSYFGGFLIIGVTCAWLGMGEWSLVAAWVSQYFLESAILYVKVRHNILPRLRSGSTPLTAFGLRVVVVNVTNLSTESIGNLLIGRAFGTTSLGAYSIAYSLVRTPVNHIVSALQQVIFPFTARAQDDPKIMRQVYLAVLWLVALATFPIFLSVGVLAPTVIEVLYGNAWLDAVPVLLPLAFAMPLVAATAVSGPVLWGSGQVAREIHVSVSVVVVLVIVLTLTSKVSLVAMAWGVWFVQLVRGVWMTAMASSVLGLSPIKSLSMLRGGLLVGALTSAALFGANSLLVTLGAPAFYRLVIAICLGAILLPGFALILSRVILPAELREVFTQLVKSLPERLRPWVRRWLIGREFEESAPQP